jgi:hypothetical protein
VPPELDDTLHTKLPPSRLGPNRGETRALVIVAIGTTLVCLAATGGVLLAILAATG